jgi:hypothetical protein
VVTEQQQVTVPVSHEELRRSSASPSPTPTAATPTTAPPSPRRSTRSPCAPSARSSAPRPKAVERVRLGTETVRGEETVSGEVRKEEIDDDVRVADRDRANTDRV